MGRAFNERERNKMYLEIEFECPICGENGHHEVEVELVCRSINSAYLKSEKDKKDCDYCGAKLNLYASGEINLEISEVKRYG